LHQPWDPFWVLHQPLGVLVGHFEVLGFSLELVTGLLQRYTYSWLIIHDIGSYNAIQM